MANVFDNAFPEVFPQAFPSEAIILPPTEVPDPIPGPCDPILEGCGGCKADELFRAVYVKPRVSAGTIVHWVLGPNNLPGPLEFQLEVNHGGHSRADGWEVIQPFTKNVQYILDPKQRNAGWFQRTFYRVTARDAAMIMHQSTPIPANQGRLNSMQAGLYREVVRREQQRSLMSDTPCSVGYLLKVKYYGDRCVHCMDPDSGLSLTANCDYCYGVGFVRGYHPAYPCFNVDLSPVSSDLTMYQDQGPIITGGTSMIRYCAVPVEAHPWDVWVDARSDYRYLIGQIQPTTSFGDLNVVCNAAVARLPFDHPAYKIPLDGTVVMDKALWD